MKLNNKKPLAFKLATFLFALSVAIVPTGNCMFLFGEPELPAKMHNKEKI